MPRATRALIAATALVVLTEGAGHAELAVEGTGVLFYTDDVGIFSATRRLSRDGDPTQPALDTALVNKGSDVIFEPDLSIGKAFSTSWGRTDLSVRGQGFLYTDHERFSHGTLRLQALQHLNEATRVRLRYYYAPNLFLGENEDRQPGAEGLVPESVTSHIWSARLERNLTPNLEVRLFARYGQRRYNQAFAQRDTDFWTVGPQVKWHVSHRVTFALNYHFERGLADGRNQPQFEDDVSYINHYVSADLDVEVAERVSLMAALHYERNNWTSNIVGDERRGAHEDVVQGDLLLVRQLTEFVRVFVGVQRSNRRQSFESEGVKNTNVGIGINGAF